MKALARELRSADNDPDVPPMDFLRADPLRNQPANQFQQMNTEFMDQTYTHPNIRHHQSLPPPPQQFSMTPQHHHHNQPQQRHYNQPQTDYAHQYGRPSQQQFHQDGYQPFAGQQIEQNQVYNPHLSELDNLRQGYIICVNMPSI